MEIRNRMPDIIKLRTNACQDLLKMVLLPGWQQSLYDIAENAVNSGNNYQKGKYLHAYNKMRNRENGIECYSVDDMDITLIWSIITDWNSKNNTGTVFAPLHYDSIQALKALRNDRNITKHSNENEEADELYLRGLISLVNLRRFVYTVDEFETDVPDDQRLAYRQKYITKIKELMSTLDNERIKLVYKNREYDRLIEHIKNSKHPWKVWDEIIENFDRCAETGLFESDDPKLGKGFYLRASDAGIVYAHYHAAVEFIFAKSKPIEPIRRFRMILDACKKLPDYFALSIVSGINLMLDNNYEPTDDMRQIIEDVKKQGYTINVINNRYKLVGDDRILPPGY